MKLEFSKLSAETAARKDALGAKFPATMQHRHFAVIAAIIAELPNRMRDEVAVHFAEALAATNPKFESKRFLDACKVQA